MIRRPITHGTHSGYVRGCRCGECTEAHARYALRCRDRVRRWFLLRSKLDGDNCQQSAEAQTAVFEAMDDLMLAMSPSERRLVQRETGRVAA